MKNSFLREFCDFGETFLFPTIGKNHATKGSNGLLEDYQNRKYS